MQFTDVKEHVLGVRSSLAATDKNDEQENIILILTLLPFLSERTGN